MVGPSITEEDRRTFLWRLRIGFALLVGASMALVSLHVRASPRVIGSALLAGTAVGGVLAWYVIPDSVGTSRYEW